MKRPKSQAPEKDEKLENIKEKPDNKIPKQIPATTKSATSKPLNTIKKIATKTELKDVKEKDGKDIKDKSKDLKESKERVKPLKGGSSKNAPIVSKPKTPIANSSNTKKEEIVIDKEKVTARFETDTNEFKTEQQELPSNNANVDVDEVIITNANNEIELNQENDKEELKREIDNVENVNDVIKNQQDEEVQAEEKVLINEIESNEHNQHSDIDQISKKDNISSEQEVNNNINLPLVDKKSSDLKIEEPTIEHNNINQTNEPIEEKEQKEEIIEDKQEVLVNDEKLIENNLEIIHNSADPIHKDEEKEEIDVVKEQEEKSQENNNEQEIAQVNVVPDDEIKKEDNSANNSQEQESKFDNPINEIIDETAEKKDQELDKSLIISANTQTNDQEPVVVDSAVIEPQQEIKHIQEANLDSKDDTQSLSNNLK